MIELAPDQVSFRHPLVRAAAYQDAPAPQRRAVHAALAAHTSGARRAGHLWSAATGADDAAAAALVEAAGEARVRTGLGAAALAMERAACLTADPEERAARRFAAAQDRLAGGDMARAIELAHQARIDACGPVLGAEIDATLAILAGPLEAGHRTLCTAAETIATTDPDRAAWLLSTAAIACYMGGRVPLGHDTMVHAHALAERAGGTTERIAGSLLAGARLISGRDSGDGERELLDRWPEALDERVIMPGAPHLIGILHFLSWVERYDDADAFAAHVERMVTEAGAVGALLLLRMGQLEVDFRRGDWARARVRVSEALRLGEETGQLIQRAPPLATLARLEAALGLEGECRATCAELLALALPAGLRSMNVYRESALGLLELGLGRAQRAAGHLDAAARLCIEYGQLDPSVVLFHPDRIEAHVRAGNTDRAREALAEFERMAERTQRRWPLACVARCHGMLEGDFEPWFERAYTHHRPDESPLRARPHRAGAWRMPAAGPPAPRGARAPALGTCALRAPRRRAVGRARPSRVAGGGWQGPLRPSVHDPRAHAAGTRGGAGRRARRDQSRGRGRALRESEDRRGPPEPDVSQARRALAHRARERARRRPLISRERRRPGACRARQRRPRTRRYVRGWTPVRTRQAPRSPRCGR